MKTDKLNKLRERHAMTDGLRRTMKEELESLVIRRSHAKSYLAEYHQHPTRYANVYRGHDRASLKRLLAEESEIEQQYQDVRERYAQLGKDTARLATLVRRAEEWARKQQGQKAARWFHGNAPSTTPDVIRL